MLRRDIYYCSEALKPLSISLIQIANTIYIVICPNNVFDVPVAIERTKK